VTRRENLLKVLRHEMPDWVPICGHVDAYNQPSREGMDPKLAEALGTVRWGDESGVLFSRDLDIDIMDWYSGPPVRWVRHDVTVESSREGTDTTTVWHTPKGDLREVSRQCREDGTSYRLEHLVNDAEDLPAFASTFEDLTFEPDPDRAAHLAARREFIGEDGIIAFPIHSTPLGMMIRAYAGVAATTYLHADAPDALRDLFAVMEDCHVRLAQHALQYDAEVLITVDDTSTTTISPKMFETYCMDYTDRLADLTHEAGKCYLHHSCGLIKNLLPLYRQTRMDGVHAFTIPPIGDVMVKEGREVLGPDMIIFAGLSQLFGSLDDWDAVGESVREMFEGAAPGANFILGLAGDPEKTMDQTRRLREICRPYQSCPLKV